MNFKLNEACNTRIASSRKAPIASAITAFLRPEVLVSARVGFSAAKASVPARTQRRHQIAHYRAVRESLVGRLSFEAHRINRRAGHCPAQRLTTSGAFASVLVLDGR